jgi:hypothetical protein
MNQPWSSLAVPPNAIIVAQNGASVQTTERYLGCKQKLRHAVNDNLGLEDS